VFERSKATAPSHSESPLVLAVVLNWNGWRDCVSCVESLRRATYPNLRVILIDNGSTDGSEAQLRSRFPDLVLLQTGLNLGFAGGSNVGIRYALNEGADYVWLLGNDMLVTPSALSALVEVADKDARIGAVGSILHPTDKPNAVHIWGGGWVHLWTGFYGIYRRPVSVSKLGYLTGGGILIRTTALKHAGLLDESFFLYWEDVELSFRLREAGWKLAVAPEAHIYHAAPSSNSVARRDLYATVSGMRFFRIHAPVWVVPVVLGQTARVLKRLVRGDWNSALSVLRAIVAKSQRHDRHPLDSSGDD
jgi:GT2 family glycosyltransferase